MSVPFLNVSQELHLCLITTEMKKLECWWIRWHHLKDPFANIHFTVQIPTLWPCRNISRIQTIIIFKWYTLHLFPIIDLSSYWSLSSLNPAPPDHAPSNYIILIFSICFTSLLVLSSIFNSCYHNARVSIDQALYFQCFGLGPNVG